MSPVAKSRTSTPAPAGFAPAGDAERRLLEALAERYGAAEFSARAAAADLSPALWQAAGVPRPDAGVVRPLAAGSQGARGRAGQPPEPRRRRPMEAAGGAGIHPLRPRAGRGIPRAGRIPGASRKTRHCGPAGALVGRSGAPAAIDAWRGRGARRRGLVVDGPGRGDGRERSARAPGVADDAEPTDQRQGQHLPLGLARQGPPGRVPGRGRRARQPGLADLRRRAGPAG
jgi:hypothetical protein